LLGGFNKDSGAGGNNSNSGFKGIGLK